MDEIPKYRKRSKKRAPKKSKHKHHYENCVFRYTIFREDQVLPFDNFDRWQMSIGEYCPECGKIGAICDTEWKKVEKARYGYQSVWNDCAIAEFNEETRTLPYFEVENIWKNKFVEL